MSAVSPVPPSSPSPSKLVYDLKETASLLRVSVSTVRRAIKRGDLRPTRIGKRVLVTHENIVKFLRKKHEG